MSASSSSNFRGSGPHSGLTLHSDQERRTAELLDLLWQRYRERVEYVRTYEQVVQSAGATFVNDHIAFRTFACQQPMLGIAGPARLFTVLGYRVAGAYQFEDKHLDALHLRHPNPDLPKLFISELRVWELEPEARQLIQDLVQREAREPLNVEMLAELHAGGPEAWNRHRNQVLAMFHELPWAPPTREQVDRLNESSQYAAWVAVHGNAVNHFTALINSHQVEALDDLEKTVTALKEAGVPMKDEIEGQPGSKLRQTATEAVTIEVPVRTSDGTAATMPWTYAYFELAERGDVTDPESGKKQRFEGFLGPQANQLFDMTAQRG